MNKVFTFFGVLLAVFLLLPDMAYSRGGGGGRNQNNNDDGPSHKASPTPAPAAVPVQGVITDVTPFAVSIKSTPQTGMATTYKVSDESSITVNGSIAPLAALKPGMMATITPAADKIYATSIAATVPVAAQPQTPATGSVPAAAVPASGQGTSGSTWHPFGQQAMP